MTSKKKKAIVETAPLDETVEEPERSVTAPVAGLDEIVAQPQIFTTKTISVKVNKTAEIDRNRLETRDYTNAVKSHAFQYQLIFAIIVAEYMAVTREDYFHVCPEDPRYYKKGRQKKKRSVEDEEDEEEEIRQQSNMDVDTDVAAETEDENDPNKVN